ncbi:hypothetical protein PMAYCL1PPCAC_04753 [Pristionchus mayeri]|uniref:Uncharacterized protein n=1 Tax=Pristionchus mayeri TaxID=1317129 RepID=A0AAN4Z9S4_9BILA|nr:hypothetical protein PMAYCL1PPCAC_04753 [Pristionchus mayeri]
MPDQDEERLLDEPEPLPKISCCTTVFVGSWVLICGIATLVLGIFLREINGVLAVTAIWSVVIILPTCCSVFVAYKWPSKQTVWILRILCWIDILIAFAVFFMAIYADIESTKTTIIANFVRSIYRIFFWTGKGPIPKWQIADFVHGIVFMFGNVVLIKIGTSRFVSINFRKLYHHFGQSSNRDEVAAGTTGIDEQAQN